MKRVKSKFKVSVSSLNHGRIEEVIFCYDKSQAYDRAKENISSRLGIPENNLLVMSIKDNNDCYVYLLD